MISCRLSTVLSFRIFSKPAINKYVSKPAETLSGKKRRESETSSLSSSSGSCRVEETQQNARVNGTPVLETQELNDSGAPELPANWPLTSQDLEQLDAPTSQDLEQLNAPTSQDLEELNNMSSQPRSMYQLRTSFTDQEKDILKSVIVDYGLKQVKSGRKNWACKQLWLGILKKYNEEVHVKRDPSMTAVSFLQIVKMAESIDWCNCPPGSRELCDCLIPQVLQTSDAETSLSLTKNSVKQFSSSGNSKKRSHDSSINEGLIERVASIMFGLVKGHQMTFVEAQLNAEIYSAMLNHGLQVNVEMICQFAQISRTEDLLKAIEYDKKRYEHLRNAE